MSNLRKLLEDFELTSEDFDKLAKNETPDSFTQIAAAILGGYFQIKSGDNVKVKVIPTCVELYYHEEREGGVEDLIVYHRNTKKHDKEVFPFGILHNHVSGIDITFEKGNNTDSAIRASALIREFRIENGQNTTTIELKEVEDRPTYIYAALFSQFNIFDGFTIKWMDVHDVSIKDIDSFPRKNVMQYVNGEKTNIPDERKWQFKRKQL